MSQAIAEEEFSARIDSALKSLFDDMNDDPKLILAFLPQPDRMVDIVGLEDELDSIFQEACRAGLANLRDGYEMITKKDWTGLKTSACRLAYFADGMLLII
jgi:hypothetical protein